MRLVLESGPGDASPAVAACLGFARAFARTSSCGWAGGGWAGRGEAGRGEAGRGEAGRGEAGGGEAGGGEAGGGEAGGGADFLASAASRWRRTLNDSS